MNSSHNPDEHRRLWIVKLRGHHDEIEQAVAAIHENQAEVFQNCQYHGGDDDEVTATILLRWVDTVMPRLVQSIIEVDFPHIKIVRNREVTKNDDEVSSW